MNYSPYIKMQKSLYENPNFPSERIVGNYDWHEEFPYESLLLYINGDIRKPIFSRLDDKLALDFACGPGRMVPRMKKLFQKVDGADISKKLVEEARAANPGSDFFVTSGDDLGETPLNTYDFVYSTIALQHIAVRSVRLKIFQGIADALKQGGKATLQMAYSNEYPYQPKRDYKFNEYRMMLWKKSKQHAAWDEDRVNAKGTNSSCDVYINKSNLSQVKEDFEKIFKSVRFWFCDVEILYKTLHPTSHHMDYWPSHWIFIHVEK